MHFSGIRQTSVGRVLALSLTPILNWAAFGLALAVAYVGFATGRISLDLLYNSDALYLPVLYRDLASGQGMSGWALTPAPYFFPDMPLFFGLNFMLNNFQLAVIAYGLVQVLLFVAGLTALSRLMAGRNPDIQCLVPLAGALFFLYFYAAPYPFFSLVFANAFHFSVMVVGIGCLALIGVTVARPRIDRVVVVCVLAVLLCSTLMVASDLLYVIQVLAPMMLSLWLLALCKQIPYRRALFYSLLGLSLPVGLWAGTILSRVLTGTDTRFALWPFSLQIVEVALSELLDWCRSLWFGHPLLPSAAICFALVGGRMLVLLIRGRKQPSRSAVRLLVVSFLAFQIVASALTILYTGVVMERYLLPLLVVPTFFGWPLLAAAARRLPRFLNSPWVSRITASAVILSCLVILAFNSVPQQVEHLADYYPDLVRCMDVQTEQRHLKSGLADYWQAKYISMLSHHGLRVVQLNTALRPWHWINNLHWYAQPFDFVMIDHAQLPEFRLDRRLVIERFGPPDDSFSCGSSEILVYHSVQFREQFLTPTLGHE
ncbi:MAG: hypothetical protein OHK0022_34590 [Roseiflexaceae bacterium]